MTPDEVAARLECADLQPGDHRKVSSPLRDDLNPSLNVTRQEDGTFTFYDHGAPTQDSKEFFKVLVASLNGTDPQEGSGKKAKEEYQGPILTLPEYAMDRGLPLSIVEEWCDWHPRFGVCFPITPHTFKHRDGGPTKYRWVNGKSQDYPLWPPPKDAVGEVILIAAGETDALTLRLLGHEAYGVTGGENARHLGAPHFALLRDRGARTVYLVRDADVPGDAWVEALGTFARAAGLNVQVVNPDPNYQVDLFNKRGVGFKDINDVYQDQGEAGVTARFAAAVEYADDYSETGEEFDAAADDEVDWIIEGFIAPGDKIGIVAPPKTMKTYLVLHLVRAFETGEPPFGRGDLMPARPTRCLLVEMEGNRVLFARRRRKVANGMPGEVKEPARIRFRKPYSLVQADTDVLIEHVRQHEIRVVILDPFQRMTGDAEENSSTEMKAVMEQAERIALETGAAVIIVHHTSKGAGLDIHAGRGTSRFGGDLDCQVSLTKDPNNTPNTLAMRVEGRDVNVATEAGTAAVLEYEFTDEAFFIRDTSLTIHLDPRSQKPVPETAAETTLSLLIQNPGCTADEMAEMRGVDRSNAVRALNALVAAHKATKDKTVRPNAFHATKAER